MKGKGADEGAGNLLFEKEKNTKYIGKEWSEIIIRNYIGC